MIRRRSRTALVTFAAFAATVTACGGGSGGGDTSSAPTSVPLSSEQASRLADVLFDNLDTGGARFTVSARTAAGDTLTMTGEVDWVAHTGRADVVATGAEEDLVEVVWTEDVILERRPALLATLLDRENLAFDFVARAPAPTTRPIDRVVAVIAALAGEQRDNPLLLQQSAGSASFGTDTIDGRTVEVLRFGEENRYWLDAETGDLLRFEQPPSPTRDAFVIDLVERGPQTVALPRVESAIPATDIPDLYPFP